MLPAVMAFARRISTLSFTPQFQCSIIGGTDSIMRCWISLLAKHIAFVGLTLGVDMTAAPNLKQVKGHRWRRQRPGMLQVLLIRNSTF